MRHLGIVASSAPQASAPTITIASTTDFNQNSAVFNATVNPNGATTSVKFQYSTNGSSWTDGTTNTGITGGSQSTSASQSGLTAYGTTGGIYYVRAIATNSAGSTTSGSTTFSTYGLRTVTYTSGSGTWTNPVPTSGTSGLAISSILDALVVGGGGGGLGSAGGAGGVSASNSISVGSSLNYSVGGAGSQGGTTSNTTAGDPSSLERPGVWTMTGGGGGTANVPPYNSGAPSGAGSGGTTYNSISYGGGGEQYGCSEYASGGGGGAGGPGADAYITGGYVFVGGNAGAAASTANTYGISVSSGGPGSDWYGADGYQNGSFTETSYGGGGARYELGVLRNPQSGLVRFTYYGP